MRNEFRMSFLASIAALIISAPFDVADAAPLTFTIDPIGSWLTVSGSSTVAGFSYSLSEQAGGSLTSTLQGTLVADISPATSISFPGGSSIIPEITGNWQPAAGGNAGVQPAQYGAQISVDFFGNIYYAAHDAELDTTSGSTPLSPDFVFADQFFFDASVLTVHLLAATIDFNQFNGFDQGTEVFANEIAPNIGAPLGFLDASSSVWRLIVPIKAGQYNLQFGDFIANVTLEGQIAANVTVPESPSWLLLGLGLGLSGFAYLSRRHNRARSVLGEKS